MDRVQSSHLSVFCIEYIPDVSLGKGSPKVVERVSLEALEIIRLCGGCLSGCHGLWVVEAGHVGGGGRCSRGKIEGKLGSGDKLRQGQLQKMASHFIKESEW